MIELILITIAFITGACLGVCIKLFKTDLYWATICAKVEKDAFNRGLQKGLGLELEE